MGGLDPRAPRSKRRVLAPCLTSSRIGVRSPPAHHDPTPLAARDVRSGHLLHGEHLNVRRGHLPVSLRGAGPLAGFAFALAEVLRKTYSIVMAKKTTDNSVIRKL